jgi:hypothetical protein
MEHSILCSYFHLGKDLAGGPLVSGHFSSAQTCLSRHVSHVASFCRGQKRETDHTVRTSSLRLPRSRLSPSPQSVILHTCPAHPQSPSRPSYPTDPQSPKPSPLRARPDISRMVASNSGGHPLSAQATTALSNGVSLVFGRWKISGAVAIPAPRLTSSARPSSHGSAIQK